MLDIAPTLLAPAHTEPPRVGDTVIAHYLASTQPERMCTGWYPGRIVALR